MAIITLVGALAGMQASVFYNKATTPSLVAGRPHSLWYLTGGPGPGTSDKATANGVALTAPQNGAIPFTNPVAGNTNLSLMRGWAASQAGTFLLCDRLLVCGANSGGSALAMTSTAAQTLNTAALPARDNAGSINGAGVLAGIEIETATGAGTPTVTLGYTNSAGTVSRTAANIQPTVANSAIGAFYQLGLQAGDLGIGSVQSLTLSASWASGAMVLVLYRILAAVECLGNSTPGKPLDLASGGFPQIYNGSVLFPLFVPSTTTSSLVRGMVGWTQG